MKRFLIFVVFALLLLPLPAQDAWIYYEGMVMYPIKHYSYEFQSLVDHHFPSRISHITDSTFLTFLDKKIETAERCTEDEACADATYKPACMIQIVYIKNKYCYYTINLSSGWGLPNSLTIDGKSYIPDDEFQDIIVEIVKYRFLKKKEIPAAKIHAIIDGERDDAPEDWPIRPSK